MVLKFLILFPNIFGWIYEYLIISAKPQFISLTGSVLSKSEQIITFFGK